MKADDFNLAEEIRFNFDKGLASFKNNRLVIFDANSIGLLRQNLIDQLGWAQARSFFLRFGYQNGYSDFMQMKVSYEFESEAELLASGPVIHTWEGIVHAKPSHLEYDRDTGHFKFTGVWTNSYEAEQHLTYNRHSREPVCWSLMGYASGWCTAFFGRPVIAIEPSCVGRGDDECKWDIRPPSEWGPDAAPYLEALRPFIGGTDNG
ncbi:XylR N-terminal domain-containing protein [bacterium]|nr:XylR N-terminal domain-containing protein [bacterium]